MFKNEDIFKNKSEVWHAQRTLSEWHQNTQTIRKDLHTCRRYCVSISSSFFVTVSKSASHMHCSVVQIWFASTVSTNGSNMACGVCVCVFV